MPRNSSVVTVMKFEIKKIEFRIRFFGNDGRISNINRRLEIEIFTLSHTKVYENIICLINRIDTVNEHQFI